MLAQPVLNVLDRVGGIDVRLEALRPLRTRSTEPRDPREQKRCDDPDDQEDEEPGDRDLSRPRPKAHSTERPRGGTASQGGCGSIERGHLHPPGERESLALMADAEAG